MHDLPFLTDLDTRAAVKGSRDPLGIQAIWTKLGRHVVGNLTTVSTSVRDYTTLLLGYFFAEKVAELEGPGLDLATFLKWEQLAAYCRAEVNDDKSFRGMERVWTRLADSPRITLSADGPHQILGNQKIYGLWGLYTVPARTSGLLQDDPPRLTPVARELVEGMYLSALTQEGFREGRKIAEILRRPLARLDVRGSDKSLACAIGRLLRLKLIAKERQFFREHLLWGGGQDPTHGRQRQLAELLESTVGDEGFGWSTTVVAGLAADARARGDGWHDLADKLDRIRVCESVAAPMSALFTHLLGLDGFSLNKVVDRLRTAWGPSIRTIPIEAYRELRDELADDDVGRTRWIAIAEAGVAGDYAGLLDLLFEQNRQVMSGRGGTPWIEKNEGRLKVRFRDEQGQLPSRKDLPQLWRFSYFLDSLRTVATTLTEN